MPSESSAAEAPLTSPSRGLVLTMATACGVSVASIYCNQPLLGEIRHTFSASASQLGLVPTLTQLGFAVGLVLLVPLGNRHERRGIFVWLSVASALALTSAALAPTLGLLCAASFAVGMASVIPPAMTPFAATLSPPSERGRTVGSVMTGLLLGVLLSRILGGVIGQHLGWRAVFALAAGLLALLALGIRLLLPKQKMESTLGYGELLRSLVTLLREEPELQLSAFLGGVGFAAFSALWATLALFIARPPLGGSAEIAGAFGAVGLVGALAAPTVGRWSDRGRGRGVQLAAFAAMALGFVVLGWGRESLLTMALGALILDVGVQASHVTNLGRIYAIRADAGSRINTVYMTAYFVGGSLGSWLGAWAFGARGWTGVCELGAVLALVGLAGLMLKGSRVVAAKQTPNGAES